MRGQGTGRKGQGSGQEVDPFWQPALCLNQRHWPSSLPAWMHRPRFYGQRPPQKSCLSSPALPSPGWHLHCWAYQQLHPAPSQAWQPENTPSQQSVQLGTVVAPPTGLLVATAKHLTHINTWVGWGAHGVHLYWRCDGPRCIHSTSSAKLLSLTLIVLLQPTSV